MGLYHIIYPIPGPVGGGFYLPSPLLTKEGHTETVPDTVSRAGYVMAPSEIRGLRHVALRVKDLARSRAFYEGFFGMRPVWQPDADNLYLSSGSDNLALHQIPAEELAEYQGPRPHFLDHIGIIVDKPDTVDRLFAQAERIGTTIVHRPKQHRDGSYSCYLADPDGNTVQVLYEPRLSKL
jgi:catechol 2,3-dioxygenase-like lactoylglutathione lyase family enzyme